MGDGVAGWRTRNDDADDDDDEGDRARRESVELAAVGHCGYIRLYPAATREPVSSARSPHHRPTGSVAQHPLRGFSLLTILRRNQRENPRRPLTHPPSSTSSRHPLRISPRHSFARFRALAHFHPLSSSSTISSSFSTLDLATIHPLFALPTHPLGIPYTRRLPACRGMHLSGRLSTYLSRCTGCLSENQLPFLRLSKRSERISTPIPPPFRPFSRPFHRDRNDTNASILSRFNSNL